MFWNSDNQDVKGATLIANNAVVEGHVRFCDQLLINGVIKGNVYAEESDSATVTLTAKGEVHGEIWVPNVVINGRVVGDIHSSKHVELAPQARIKGNVYYHLIEVAMGAVVEGRLVHGMAREQGATVRALPTRDVPPNVQDGTGGDR